MRCRWWHFRSGLAREGTRTAERMEGSGEVCKRGRDGEGVFTWPLISILEAFHKQIKPSTIVRPFEEVCVCVCVVTLQSKTSPLNKYPHSKSPPSELGKTCSSPLQQELQMSHVHGLSLMMCVKLLCLSKWLQVFVSIFSSLCNLYAKDFEV